MARKWWSRAGGRAKARSDEAAKELLAKLEIREEVGGSTVRVESRPPRTSGFGGHEIVWNVKVPKGLTVDLRTINGGVRLDGLSGEIHAKTTNGGVKGQNIIPETIEASSVNGGVEIELGAPLDSTDSIDMSTVNGGVTLSMPSESKATITARCVNGGVRVYDLDIKRDDDDAQPIRAAPPTERHAERRRRQGQRQHDQRRRSPLAHRQHHVVTAYPAGRSGLSPTGPSLRVQKETRRSHDLANCP